MYIICDYSGRICFKGGFDMKKIKIIQTIKWGIIVQLEIIFIIILFSVALDSFNDDIFLKILALLNCCIFATHIFFQIIFIKDIIEVGVERKIKYLQFKNMKN